MTRIVMTMSIRTRGRIGIMIARTVSTRARERVHRRPHRARANAPRVRSRPITAKANAGDEEETPVAREEETFSFSRDDERSVSP